MSDTKGRDGPRDLCTEEVDTTLEGYPALMDRIVKLIPDMIAPNFDYDSDVPVAAVCLRDAQSTFGQVVYALHQLCSEPAPHRDSPSPGGPMMATWLERFYAEDAAMRLYNTAEHLANAIAMLKGIPSATVASEKSRSQWERVRRVLSKIAPDDPIHVRMRELRRHREWRFTMKYRGNVVHQQPPILAGLGMAYRRRPRWSKAPDGTQFLRMSSTGDAAHHAPEDVKRAVLTAAERLLDLMTAVTEEYFKLLNSHGIHETPAGLDSKPFRLEPRST